MMLSALRKLNTDSMASIILKTSATNFIVMSLTMITSIITARMFGVEGKGEFSAIIFWPTFIAGILGLGLPTSLIYNLKQKSNAYELNDYVKLTYLYQIPLYLVVGCLVWYILPPMLPSYSEETIFIICIYATVTSPLILTVNVLMALSQSLDRFDIYNGLRLYVPVLNVVILLVLWVTGILSIEIATLTYFITYILVIFWSLVKLYPSIRKKTNSKISRRMVKAFYGYGGRAYGVELLGTLYSQFDKIIILSLLTARDFGLYSVIFAVSRLYNAVQTAVTSVIFPKVVGMQEKEVLRRVVQSFRTSTIIMAIIVIPTMFLGNILIKLLFGKEFGEASTALYILSVECVIGGGSWILAAAFNATGRPGLVLLRQIVALSITIALFYLLTPLYGLNGIAISLLIGAVVRLLVTVVSMHKVFKITYRTFLFSKTDFQFIVKFVNKATKKRKKGVTGDEHSA